MSANKNWNQLDLFSVSFDVQGVSVVEMQPVATEPVKTIKQSPTHTITHNPLKGYKVVMAPGLNASPRNPCLSCPDFGRDMDTCSENCARAAERASYLESIGMGETVCGVDMQAGSYGIGC